jgi:RimJ/RimL family protein N-acetyltransferase
MPRIPASKARLTGSVNMSGPAIVLETGRFKLRSLKASDASRRYLNWIADEVVMTPLNMPPRKLTRPELANYISAFDNRSRYLVGMFDKQTDIHFGILQADIAPQHALAKLSFLIGEREYRGIGALRECALAFISCLFTVRDIEKVSARVTVGNDASRVNFEKMGFRNEGLMVGEIKSFKDGSRLDQHLFGIVKQEWAPPKA